MNVRDSDTSLWLHNKLGTSNDLWSGGSIISQLNQDVLRNIRECFADLQSQVKLKLLLSFLHVSRRNVDEVISVLRLFILFNFCSLIMYLFIYMIYSVEE